MLADGVAGDGEAEAGAGAGAGWIGFVEAFEDAVEFVEGEAGACVGDADNRIVVGPVRGDADGAARGRELDGVVDEAHDDAGGAVGIGADGERRFSLSFTPRPLEHGGGSFVFFVPYEPEWATTLDRLVLTGPEGEYTVTRDGEPAMAVLTDPSTGSIRAFHRNWDGERIPGEETANVTVTRGIPAGGLPR